MTKQLIILKTRRFFLVFGIFLLFLLPLLSLLEDSIEKLLLSVIIVSAGIFSAAFAAAKKEITPIDKLRASQKAMKFD